MVVVVQCSFSVCLRNREESVKAVERYVDEWRAKKQTPFRCYYDTMSLDTVIVQKMYSTADVVHRSVSTLISNQSGHSLPSFLLQPVIS